MISFCMLRKNVHAASSPKFYKQTVTILSDCKLVQKKDFFARVFVIFCRSFKYFAEYI